MGTHANIPKPALQWIEELVRENLSASAGQLKWIFSGKLAILVSGKNNLKFVFPTELLHLCSDPTSVDGLRLKGKFLDAFRMIHTRDYHNQRFSFGMNADFAIQPD